MTFSDAAADSRTAVPTTPGPLDPDNPDALGYDPFAAGIQAARRAAAADPELDAAFLGQLRRETARFRAWVQAYRRAGAGGCGRGAGPDPFAPAEPAELLARADLTLARRRAWRASPEGRLAAALAETEAAAETVRAALVETRSAVDRADGSTLGRIEAASTLIDGLKASAHNLWRAAAQVGRPSSADPEQRDALWRLTREICAPPSETVLSGAALREG